jgi:hypothetical protein
MKLKKVQVQLIFLLSYFSVIHSAQIRLCVRAMEKGSSEPLADANVVCYDEDYANGDDIMTGSSKRTGSNGCVTLSYRKKKSSWWNCYGWDCTTNPDIYCKVKKTGYYPLYTNTKNNANQERTANLGTVYIFPDRVQRGDVGTINGCGPSDFDGINNVADFLTGFGDMCNNHDLCYNACGETQQSCDNEFLFMMRSECNDHWDSNKRKQLCKSVARSMYFMVHTRGEEYYNYGQELYGC